MEQTVTVITSGEFMLVDVFADQTIESLIPTEVKLTTFVKDRIELGQLVIVPEDTAPVPKPRQSAKPKAE